MVLIVNPVIPRTITQAVPEKEKVNSYARTARRKSVLSDFEWYKIAVSKDGIYKIDAEFLKSMGIDIYQVDPATIRIFGNGGKMLPQSNMDKRYDGLQENAIFVQSKGAGFSDSDYIIFYGQGTDTKEILHNSGEIKLNYEKNLYSDSSFYFLTFGGPSGKRITSAENHGENHPVINSYLHVETYEIDQFNIVNSGRYWYGEKFDLVTSYNFDFYLPGIKSNTTIKINSVVMAKSTYNSSFQLSVNGIIVGNQEIDAIPAGTYTVKGYVNSDTFEINSNLLSIPDNILKLDLTYDKPSQDSHANGYLDYFTILCERELKAYNSCTFFRSVEALKYPFITYEISASDKELHVWDISDPLTPEEIEWISLSGKVRFGAEGGELSEYVVFTADNIPEPVFIDKIANQDLTGSIVPDLLIVTHSDFYSEASRLAEFRESHDGLKAKVVTTEEIYNEFSSGSQDVTAIRDYVKYLYDQREPGAGLKYLLFFGRGSFDYKDRLDFNTNFVPIYQSRNSLHPIYSYASDDYYTFLEDDEGIWEEYDGGSHTMDIGVGRLPVITVNEAKAIVDKLILYETHSGSYGSWRNEVIFVADDGDGVDGIIHSKQADDLASYVDTVYTNFNVNKIYVDAYPQIRTPNRQLAPEVNQAINDAVQKGALIMNYTGHGAESGWTSESVLDIAMLTSWENLYRLPVLVTATCEFGRNDNPKQRSGAEFAITNPNGGAIGLVTTSRPVFSNPNYELNLDFYQNVFNKKDGKYPHMGDIFKSTKNLNTKVVIRNFILLGDPSMKLAYPDKEIVITHINESEIDQSDTLKALKMAIVKGNVLNTDGDLDTDFSGILTATVFDKPFVKQTLGTEDPVMTFEEREVVFRGDVTVNRGQFDFKFVMPRNISYTYGKGKISLYAITDGKTEDAAGSNSTIKIGGSEESITYDNVPPHIEMYMNDTSFFYGGLVGENPILIARIFDENGITLSGSEIGQGIVLTIDEEQEIIVSNFYKNDVNSYQAGTLRYPLTGLQEGKHHIILKVWDTHNNSSQAQLEFVVADRNTLVIQNFLNYPNPFRDETTISFEHNRSGEDLEFIIEIFDLNGQIVKKSMGSIKHSEFRVNDVTWDGRNSSGKKMQSGLYICRIFVRSLRDGAKNQGYHKLVMIN